MTENKATMHYVTACFTGFDKISQKLILSKLKHPDYQIELMEEPQDADLCLHNQEFATETEDILALKGQLAANQIPLILLTEDDSFNQAPLFTVIKKPDQSRDLNAYLSELRTVFYEVLSKQLKQQAKHKATKQIYNKHLSNAINPTQIQYESNRFYAQKYVGLNPDIDFNDEAQLQTIFINARNYFFYYLKQAFELSQSSQKITCIKTVYGTFFVDAADKVIYHDKTAEKIINIHKIPFYKDSQVFIPKLKRGQMLKLYQFDYEPFVWLSSINASKGKVPDDTPFSEPVRLHAWPDLSKLVVFKHAMRIISLWSRGVYSLQHSGKILQVPQRYPLTVYTALHALGLIAPNNKR